MTLHFIIPQAEGAVQTSGWERRCDTGEGRKSSGQEKFLSAAFERDVTKRSCQILDGERPVSAESDSSERQRSHSELRGVDDGAA